MKNKMKLEINKSYSITALIELVKNKLDREFDDNGKEKYNPENAYYVYISKDAVLNENSVLYVGKPVEIDDDDNEIYPPEVSRNNLEMCYSDENFQDVIDLAYSQKSDASIEEFVKCLNYYMNNDDFLDLEN